MESFPLPKSTKDVHSFLGLISYFRRFIEGFAVMAKPLYDLLKTNVEFKFGENELRAFEDIKSKLISSPLLAVYSPKDPTELHCDPSSLGFCAILMQRKADMKFHPVFYFSKRTTDTESRYHRFELETMAIIYALRRFRIYLQGIKFKIITDCDSLKLTLDKKEINHRISRWALELQEYDYEMEHRAGSKMRHVDALSRVNNILVIEDNPLTYNLALRQLEDIEIQKIRKKVEQQEDAYFVDA